MKKMKSKNGWTCLLLVLAGIVLGGFIGSLFPSSFMNFGLTNPLILDFGILSITFALTIKITIASILGIVIALLIYRIL